MQNDCSRSLTGGGYGSGRRAGEAKFPWRPFRQKLIGKLQGRAGFGRDSRERQKATESEQAVGFIEAETGSNLPGGSTKNAAA